MGWSGIGRGGSSHKDQPSEPTPSSPPPTYASTFTPRRSSFDSGGTNYDSGPSFIKKWWNGLDYFQKQIAKFVGVFLLVIVVAVVIYAIAAVTSPKQVSAVVTACTWERSVRVEEPVVSLVDGWGSSCTGPDCMIVPNSCVERQNGTAQEQIPGSGRWVVVGTHKEKVNCVDEDYNCGWVEIPGSCTWVRIPGSTWWEDTDGDGYQEEYYEEEEICEQEWVCDTRQVCEEIVVEDEEYVYDYRTVPVYDNWCSLERTSWQVQTYQAGGNILPIQNPVYTHTESARISPPTGRYSWMLEVSGDKPRTISFEVETAEELGTCQVGDEYNLELRGTRILSMKPKK